MEAGSYLRVLVSIPVFIDTLTPLDFTFRMKLPFLPGFSFYKGDNTVLICKKFCLYCVRVKEHVTKNREKAEQVEKLEKYHPNRQDYYICRQTDRQINKTFSFLML